MKCQNHPGAPAIENCARCEIPLCGMCANFTHDEVLCEACVEVRENEQTVAAKTEELERPEPTAAEPEYDEAILQSARKKETNWEAVQIGIIGICAAILIARLFLSGGTDETGEADPQALAQLQMLSSLAECMVMFQQIGEGLLQGEMPNRSTTCPGSSQPIIITETAGDVLVAHPEPELYGYSQISVSRSNPVPEIVQ